MIGKLFSKTWFRLLLLTLVGCSFWFVFWAYRYTALLFWGYVGVRCCYLLLRKLQTHKPRLAKGLRIVFTAGLCLVLVVCVVTVCFIASGASGTEEPESQYLLVLGAGVNGTVPSHSLSQRLHAAYDYLTAYPGAICIVSGGQGPGEDITEAKCMYDWLTGKGIDCSRVWMEDKATSTEENIRFTLTLIEEKTGQRPETMAILSSEYHLYRASLMAEDEGITMLGVPAKTRPFPLRWHYYFREILALWYYLVLS